MRAVLLETLFVHVWGYRSFLDNPKVLRFCASLLTDGVQLQNLIATKPAVRRVVENRGGIDRDKRASSIGRIRRVPVPSLSTMLPLSAQLMSAPTVNSGFALVPKFVYFPNTTGSGSSPESRTSSMGRIPKGTWLPALPSGAIVSPMPAPHRPLCRSLPNLR